MVKKLLIFALTLLLSSTAFSQHVTQKTNNRSVIDTCVIVLTCDQARAVAVDLKKGDSAIVELDLVWELLAMTENKVLAQNEIINALWIKDQNYQQQINLYIKKEENYQFMVDGLQKDLKKKKLGTKVLGVAVAILGTYTLVTLVP